MARDIVSEAVKQAEAMKEAAYENAKSVLVEAMSTNLKAAVTEAIDEKIEDAEVDPVEGEQSVEEAAVEEGSDYGGNKGDESKSRRDFEENDDVTEDDDEEEIADDAYDVDDDAGDEEGEEDLDEVDIEEVIEIIEDDEEDEDDDDGEEVDIDIDVDADEEDEEDDDDIDEDEEYGGNKGDESRSKRDYEAAVQENKSLKKENKRYAKALTFLKKRIDEVNLFNARLAAASDVMKAVTLTKEEKETVVEHFDSCKSVNEIKRTFQVLTEAYKANDKTAKKVRVDRPNVQSVISEETQKTESDSQFDRMAQLAGLK